ncbi:hypothetical protein QFC20_004636 [Naganishia adeliensis]|uniref:Uncharacterized protein n=1 Tax=Naganishia adeliensis TaxID=92952 RepID=A0ACC2VYD2_9TREE|nr:hypothetical protein QFC20_004636 [Naganishia adeliensis]
MEASADLTSAQRENLQVISQSADDLQRIVTAVLDWSKLDARSITPEVIPFDLRNVIENALETVAHLARSKSIKLLLENPVSTDPPMALLGDPHRYRQCLLNLLSNAIKFTKPTMPSQYSTVSVSWSWQEHPDKVEITCAVKDEGIGKYSGKVDAQALPQFLAGRLRLSITRGLARLLGGDCWAESVEGQGSTFYLLVAAAKTSGPDAELPMAYPRGSPRQAVLYAPACLASSVLQANLQEFGINATLAKIEESNLGTAPDFVFVDVDEPTINSEVLQTLRSRHEESKFVFLVTLTDVSKLVNSLALNQEAIVTKPLKAQSLYNTTKNLDASSSGSALKAAKKTSTMDSSYAKKYPLKICYIDDSSVNVAVGKKILSKFGYKNIDVCYDGNQAVEAAERTKYDLMLMDLQMPNMDGHTARKLISENEKCGNPMVVALTANCDQPTKDRCLREGFADFLTKPLIISDLAKLLIRAYDVRNNNGV